MAAPEAGDNFAVPRGTRASRMAIARRPRIGLLLPSPLRPSGGILPQRQGNDVRHARMLGRPAGVRTLRGDAMSALPSPADPAAWNRLYTAALGGAEDTVLTTRDLPEGSEDERYEWIAWPTELPAYEAFVEYALALAAAYLGGQGDPPRAAVIDWTGRSEEELARGGETSGWVDPSSTVVGSASREIVDQECLMEAPLYVTRRRRELSLITTALPTYREDGGPSFYDLVIDPLVGLPEPSDLEDWLRVFLPPFRGEAVAWIGREAPGAAARRAADAFGVRLGHVPLAELPAPLVARHKAFRFLAVTEAQAEALRRRLGLLESVEPPFSPPGRTDVLSLTEGRRAPEVLPALARMSPARQDRLEALLLEALEGLSAAEDLRAWDRVAAAHQCALLFLDALLRADADAPGDGADDGAREDSARDDGARDDEARRWREAAVANAHQVAEDGDLFGLAQRLQLRVLDVLAESPWRREDLPPALAAALLDGLAPNAPAAATGSALLRGRVAASPGWNGDMGPAAVARVFTGMAIDDEWSVRSERQVTWWGWALAQQVLAGPPVGDPDEPDVDVRVLTTLLHDAPDEPDLHAVLAELNARPMLSALVYDREEGAVLLHARVRVYGATFGWASLLLQLAASAQASWAFELAPALQERVGGQLAASSPWYAPLREEPDGMLGVLDDLFRPVGAEEGALLSPEAWEAAAMPLEGLWTAEESTPDGLEVVIELEREGEARARLAATEAWQEGLGAGVALDLRLPLAPAPPLAALLNVEELRLGSGAHVLGAWLAEEAIGHRIFLPRLALHMYDDAGRAGLLHNLMLASVVRARWAWERIGWAGAREAGEGAEMEG